MSEVSIKPLGDRVVIRPLTDEEAGVTSQFGIIIPDSATKERGDQGVVVAVGPGSRNEDGDRIPLDVSVGDRVTFKSWSDKMKVGKEEYWIIAESDILGIISS
jgi:chaperonin GroES